LNLLNQNALTYADEVIIPVTCDYLALVGVKQVLRTIKDVERHLHHAVRIAGVLPTFYDGRTRLAREAYTTLRGHFKDKCLEPIRQNTRLAEAPANRKTIFEYAPDSHGAADYRRIVEWVAGDSAGLAPQVAA
jgi:chromosome partitioning protein